MYEFEAGDAPIVRVIGSTTNTMNVSVSVLYDDGTSEVITFDATSVGARGIEVFRKGGGDRFPKPGRVVSILADAVGTVKRGQYYAQFFVERQDQQHLFLSLGAFYVTNEFFGGLGHFENNLSGRGYMNWETVFHDRAGNAAALDYPLAVTNAFRKVYGIAWYYHASSDVADRSFLRPRLVNLGGVKPTGFTVSGDNALFWLPTADITLSGDEEGAYVSYGVGKDGVSVSLDDGVLTRENAASAPAPWPLLVDPDDLSILRFPAITSGEAADRHSASILIEEWLEE